MTNARLPVALVVVATMTGIATSACSSSDPRGHPSSQVAIPDSTSTSTTSGTRQGPTTLRLHRTVVAHGIRSPWGLAFLPNGKALVSTRDPGNILLVNPRGGKRLVRHIAGVVSNGAQGGEAGLLGLAVSPRFRTNHWVYAYMSAASVNRIVRMRWRHGRLGHPHVVISGIPRGLHHNGGRIAFGPDGMLYATTGESGVPSLAQQRSSLGGKILRMTPAGRPAPGNPFRNSVVYTLGHRNVEGLDWDRKGRLWATEFGEHAWDELNLIRPGRNYGWPIVEGMSGDHRFTNPKAVWRTDSAGPSGIAIQPRRRGSVAWIGALTGERLYRVRLHGNTVVGRRFFLEGRLGRIRTAEISPHGRLWITTSNTDGRATPRPGDDKIIRITVR